MSIIIRPVSSAELGSCVPALTQLLREAVDAGASLGFLPPLARDVATDYWLSLRPALLAGTRLLLAASADGGIVGSGQLSFPSAPNGRHRVRLQKLFVAQAARQRGLGALLMDALHESARERGRSLVLLSARRGDPAERFYRRLGYREIGVVPGYSIGSAGERYDNVDFYRELTV
jgi:ribosomal protein S18 acetylase RimI-like enzyme